jgi:cardiolipin synthase
MLVLISLPKLDDTIQNILMLICGIFLLMSFTLYVREYVKMYRDAKAQENKTKIAGGE